MVLLVIDFWVQKTHLHGSNKAGDTVAHKPVPCNKGKPQWIAYVLVSAVSVSAGPGIIFWINTQPKAEGSQQQVTLFSGVGEWSEVDADEDDWTPQYRGAIAHQRVFHDKNNREIHLYLGMYPTQRQGDELINDLNKISDEKIWYIRHQRAKLYNVDEQEILEQLLEKNDGSQRLVWYWYRVAGQDTVNKYQAKALQVLGLMKGIQQASIVAIAAKVDEEPEKTRKILGQFVKEMGSSINSVIDDKL